jgi:hypothetical protein
VATTTPLRARGRSCAGRNPTTACGEGASRASTTSRSHRPAAIVNFHAADAVALAKGSLNRRGPLPAAGAAQGEPGIERGGVGEGIDVSSRARGRAARPCAVGLRARQEAGRDVAPRSGETAGFHARGDRRVDRASVHRVVCSRADEVGDPVPPQGASSGNRVPNRVPNTAVPTLYDLL